jgi:hypothetical protein
VGAISESGDRQITRVSWRLIASKSILRPPPVATQ